MRIKFTKRDMPKNTSVVLLAPGGKLDTSGVFIDRKSEGFLSRALKAAAFKGGESVVEILSPTNLAVPRVLVFGVKKKSSVLDYEALGGRIAARLQGESSGVVCCADFSSESVARLALGAQLGAYTFELYKTKKSKKKLSELAFQVDDLEARKNFRPLSAVAEGVCWARDLVNEPANVLFPEEFVRRAQSLRSLGVRLRILNEAQMKKLGMNALLGVGQGSVRKSRLLVMEWRGLPKARPAVFVGKGVCFDTGGISLKPPAKMGDMKGDMAGAACVAGLMRSVARKRLRAHVVGIAALVENMPDGNAQRPGDIVTSMSGQTIEILNTDAEGRLILADALWYAQKLYKPACLVDVATLTGAILVALGQEYAGLFSTSDTLATALGKAGERTGEKVWRLPMGEAYDKMIDSKFADMQNIGGNGKAGSITAAQFLGRFVRKGVPWAHVDIAGVGMSSVRTPTNRSWGSGFGVRLFDALVEGGYGR